MCGIAGFCNLPNNFEENIRRMNKRMEHRGPDDTGIYHNEDASVVLGHQRLSIVDLSPNGAQPMKSASGRYMIAYNGEIYNYLALKKKLIDTGYQGTFRSSSDTEVLLEAIEFLGLEETIQFCKGMFAIALYDRKEESVYLIRDRVGEKPLYYGFVENGFVFASDIASIKALDCFDNPINTDVLDLYFVHGYIPAPYSIYEQIYKLMPGSILKIDAPYKVPSIKSYWSMDKVARNGQNNLFQGSFEEASCELERLLKSSIKDQMVADVPVGAFLSAGIDSSTIVALMQDLSEKQVRTFTIGMEDAAYNEAKIATEIAAHLGTKHTEWYISEENAKEVIPNISHMFGEPFADSSQIPTYLVSKMTKDQVTVSLSGDGGDELFCGYNTYGSLTRVWDKTNRIPYLARKAAGGGLSAIPFGDKKSNKTRGMLLQAKDIEHLYQLSNTQEPLALQIARKEKGNTSGQRLLEQYYRPTGIEEIHHKLMLMDMTMYHPDDILAKVDRTAMAVSLETRVPMLDRDIIEFAWTLPIDYLRRNDRGKLVLRDVLYRYVPKEMMERPKTGFAIPIEKWLKEPKLRAWAENLIDEKTLLQQGILDPAVVSKIWRDYIEKDIWRVQIWYILLFQDWLMQIK